MGKKELSKRDIWQDVSGGKAGIAEKNFFQVFSEYFKDSDFRIRKRPKEFNNIYSKLHLSKKVLAEIYTPDVKEWRHGLIPDYAIDNTKTKHPDNSCKYFFFIYFLPAIQNVIS